MIWLVAGFLTVAVIKLWIRVLDLEEVVRQMSKKYGVKA